LLLSVRGERRPAVVNKTAAMSISNFLDVRTR